MEKEFLQAVLYQENFNYDQWRKVYADFLEENGKLNESQFLRTDDIELKRSLAADLDPIWLAIVSDVKIENCGRFDAEWQKRAESWWQWAHSSHHEESLAEWQKNHPRIRFDFICNKTWQEMTPTQDPTVRTCQQCNEKVYFCDNIIDARDHGSNGHCIGIDLGVIRRKNDTISRLTIFGRPSQESLMKEEERRKPDSVSAKRLKNNIFLWSINDHRGNRAYVFSEKTSGHEAFNDLANFYQGDHQQLRYRGYTRKVLDYQDVPEADLDLIPQNGEITIRQWIEQRKKTL